MDLNQPSTSNSRDAGISPFVSDAMAYIQKAINLIEGHKGEVLTVSSRNKKMAELYPDKYSIQPYSLRTFLSTL
jgi:hypothetical protein